MCSDFERILRVVQKKSRRLTLGLSHKIFSNSLKSLQKHKQANFSEESTRVMDCLLHNDPASCGIWQG